MIYGLQIGSKFIRDLLDPQPEEMDIPAMRHTLSHVQRWSGNTGALTVWQHSRLVRLLADYLREHDRAIHEDVLFWCSFHDLHEAVIGDIPGPVKSIISRHTPILEMIEERLDLAICAAMAQNPPTPEVRAAVHHYDQMAGTLEWLHVLGHGATDWNYPVSLSLSDTDINYFLKTVRMPS